MKTSDAIYEEMKAAWEAETGLAMNDGGDMALRLRAAAVQLEALWVQADFTLRQSLPQTATGTYLDDHAQVRGLVRGAASRAKGSVRFYLTSALADDLTIPAGVTCAAASETAFVTTEAVTVAAGALFADAAAEAAEAGTGGNVPAGSVTWMPQPPTGVSRCANPAAFSGGAAEESDDDLRERVLESYRTLPNGANAAYYRARALAVDGVAAAAVLPKARGLGTVDVSVSAPGGLPSDALVAAVQSALDAEREICVDIAVSAPEAVTVDVAAALQPESGSAFATVKSAAEAALTAYFTGERLGEDVLRVRLADILYSVPGVRNYTLSAPAADLIVTAAQLPVLGSVILTEMN